MLCLGGCAAIARHPASGALPDSIATRLDDCDRLQKQLDTQNEIILKLTADVESLGEMLEYAERQFIRLERGLQNNETKASAVAALAEAQLAYDAEIRRDPRVESHSVIQQAAEKISTSDRLLSQNRYAASVYFSRKALRLVHDKEARRSVRIVAVDQANIRIGPGLEYDVVSQVALGTVLFELGSDSLWYQVETADGKSGWVHKSVTLAR